MGKRKEADKLVYDCLMIEDEAPLAENTCKYLSLSGIKVAAVSGVEEYREFIRENTARMILLDINLGDGCGYNLCRQIREETQVPIIFVSCQTEEETLLKKGEPVLLKRMEMKLLLYLIRNRNRLVGKEELFKEVWQEAYVGDGTLNVHIRKLREKVEDNPSSPVYIITEYGKGYMFRLAKEN